MNVPGRVKLDLFEVAPRFGGSDGGTTVVPQPSNTVTQSVTEPWDKQIPFLEKGFEGAEQDVLNRPLEYFPGQTFVPYSSETEQALTSMQQRATQGSPLLQSAQQQAQDTLSGQYLENPNMGALTDAVTRSIMPQVDSGFAGANRFGSPLHTEALARGIGTAVAPFAFDDFRKGRTEMERASAMAPDLANQDYYDMGQLMQVGQAREGLDTARLQDQIARHNFAQYEPGNRLGSYMGLIGGGYGGTSSGTSSGTVFAPSAVGSNPLLQGLGAAGAGVSIANGLFGSNGLFS